MNKTLFTCLSLLVCLCANGNRFEANSHEVFLEETKKTYEQVYQDVLKAYQNHLEANPQDATSLAQKCFFIENYTYAESSLLYFDSLQQDLEDCKAAIESLAEDHPEHILYRLSELWDEEATALYDQTYNAGIEDWSLDQKKRLFSHMERLQGYADVYNPDIAHTGYQETQDDMFLLGAAQYLLDAGQMDEAKLLIKRFEAETAEQSFRLAQLYQRIGDLEAAQSLLKDLQPDYSINDADLFKLNLQLDIHYVPQAQSLQSVKDSWQFEDNIKKMFNLAIEHGAGKAAAKIYQTWTADDFWQDPFHYQKFRLYQQTGNWDWGWRDLYAGLLLLSIVLICIAAAAIILAPIHYRGMYRRVHGKTHFVSQSQWTLKHALFLCSALLIAEMVLMFIFDYDGFYAMIFSEEVTEYAAAEGQYAQGYIINSLIMILASLLVLKPGIQLLKINMGNLLRAVMVTLAVFVVFKITYVLILGLYKMIMLPGANIGLVELTITDLKNQYGAWAAFIAIAVVTPILEEYLFRGVLLNSFTKHISFAWANIIQAVLFASIHENPDHFFHHVVFALIVGYLVKTQKHLYGAIVFHMLNNALAVSVLAL